MKSGTSLNYQLMTVLQKNHKLKVKPLYRKMAQFTFFFMSLFLLSSNTFAQDTLFFSICPGDSIILEGVANDGYCSSPQDVTWTSNGEVLFVDTNPGNDRISELLVAPLSSTVYSAYSPPTTCPNFPPPCGLGSYGGPGGGPQGPAGPQPAPIYYDEDWTIIQVDVVPCEGSQVSESGCLLPFTGEMFFDYCQGDLFFFLQMPNGNVFDPYFAEGVSFVPYDGQIVHFAYEFADFETNCGEDIPAIYLTCIEEAEESMPIGDDAGMTKIVSPTDIDTDGIETIQARFTNLGSTVISSATIEWKVNGVPQVPYSFNGYNIYPGVSADFNLGNYFFSTSENYIVEVVAVNPNGLSDVHPENNSTGVSLIGNPNSSSQNVLYMCKGESFLLDAPSVSPTTDCYTGCTPGTSDCLTCSTVIAPQLFTNCLAGCGSFTVTPGHSIHYQVINECVNATTGVCTSEVTDYFIVVNDCGEDSSVGNCNYEQTGTIFFEVCDGTEYYFIEQADGTIIDPYFAFGVGFEYFEGQVVAYDANLATFDSPCGGNEAFTLTCIDEVDFNTGVDVGVTRIASPSYATEGETLVAFMIKNYGTEPIYHTKVNWSLNGEAQDYFQYIAPDGEPLAPGDSTFVIGTSIFENIDYEMVAYTSAPNALPDPNPANDLASTSLIVGSFPSSSVHLGTFAVTEETNILGFATVVNLPSLSDGCSIPAVPTVEPNNDWEIKDNSFIFYPAESTTYTITYEGNCETYEFTITFQAGDGCTYDNSGTVFFDTCDNGEIYYFIESSDGTVLDPYNTDGLNFEYVDGELVEFNYIPADFASPCSGAIAVIMTCIRPSGRQIELDALLYGVYNPSTGLMGTLLSTNDVIVEAQPFSGEPWYYNGTETFTGQLTNAVDWVLVEARTGTPSLTNQETFAIETRAGILLADGSIVDPSTGESIAFSEIEEGQSYYIALRHRNHLDVLSATPVFVEGNASYDFTTAGTQAFGPEQLKATADGRYALYSGDFNGDGLIQTSDYDIWFAVPAAVDVYGQADANLDGVVQSTDYDEWFTNKAKVGIVEIRFE